MRQAVCQVIAIVIQPSFCCQSQRFGNIRGGIKGLDEFTDLVDEEIVFPLKTSN